jgi:hypothetical protein
MVKKRFRNSRLKSPTNFLCMRAFSRELKGKLIGEIGGAQNYERVTAKLDQIPLNISRTTWHNWWVGNSFPEGKNIKTLSKEFPELVDKWLASPPNNRIQRHFISLDLTKLHKIKDFHLVAAGLKTNDPAKIHIAAEKILCQIHSEWHPDYLGVISLPSIPEREGVDWSSERYKDYNFSCRKDPKQDYPVGTLLGPSSELWSPASRRSLQLYEAINPFSLLKFMLAYAVETNLPDPGLKQAFIFDFLSAINCSLVFMQTMSPGNIVENDEISRVFFLSQNFFWDEELKEDFEGPYWRLNHAFVGDFLTYLETFIEQDLLNNSWELFAELKSIYYQSLEITGLSQRELIQFFEQT